MSQEPKKDWEKIAKRRKTIAVIIAIIVIAAMVVPMVIPVLV